MVLHLQVQVGSSIAEGVGPNKRFAKRAAAEAMLQLLGYSKPSPQPDKPALKTGVNGGITSVSRDAVSIQTVLISQSQLCFCKPINNHTALFFPIFVYF